MKFLQLSDLHIGKSLFSYSLIEDQRYWCNQVIEFLKVEKHDAVIIAGDLFDRSVPAAEAVQLLDEFLCTLAHTLHIPVLAISGNHDSPQRLNFGSKLYSASGVYVAAIPQRQIELVEFQDEHGTVVFWLLPYITPTDCKNMGLCDDVHTYQAAYKNIIEANLDRLDKTKRNVLVAHGFFSNLSEHNTEIELITSESEINIGGVDIVDVNLFADFDFCAFGHLHAPQWVERNHSFYCGSPLKYSVSEENQKKCLTSIVLGPKGEISFDIHSVPALHDVKSVSGTLAGFVEQSNGKIISGDYVFINLVLQGTETSVAEKLRNVFPNYLGIKYISSQVNEFILGAGKDMLKKDIAHLFAEFYEEVNGTSLSELQKDIIVKTAQMLKEENE